MNYEHEYHAGNFADVVKHVVLIELLKRFHQKPTPFCFIDSHAGAGIYDLNSFKAQKTQEADWGITKLAEGENHPEWLQNYLDIVDSFQSGAHNYYPGSPAIANTLLREDDKMIANELKEDIYEELSYFFRRDKQVSLHRRDAYEFLPAVLPPKPIGRGLILIDPPFEKTTEVEDLTSVLKEALQRFAHGVYMVWFPLTDKVPRLRLPKALVNILVPEKYLYFEFSIDNYTPRAKGLLGCAMLIINPPWQFEKTLETILKVLWEKLSIDKKGFYNIVQG